MSKAEELLETPPNTELDIQHIDYDPAGMPNSKNAEDRAQKEGLTVVYPKKNQLFIDLDNEHSYQMFVRLYDIFKKFISEDSEYEVKPSKSGLPKRHVTLYSYDRIYTEKERVMFQALLGSDRVRELLGYVQAVNGDPHPTLFLEAGLKALPAAPEVLQLSGSILTDEEIPF